MSSTLKDKQKSLKRRFLFILGVVTFICVCAMGIMIIFWDRIDFGLSGLQKALFGGFFIAYGLIRFLRLLKREPDEE